MTRLILLAILWSGSADALIAKSYIITKMDGTVVLEKGADIESPIASITKLFVAEQAVKLDGDEMLTVKKIDLQRGRMRSTPLRVGGSYTRRELTQLALISSDNVAALTLARYSEPNTSHATLVEGSGLSRSNVSTARRLAEAVRELYPTEVGAISTETRTSVGNRRSTNPLLTKAGWQFMLSKTGFTNPAGGCLAVVVEVRGEMLTIVILGSRDGRTRWNDLVELRKMLGDTDFFVPVKVTRVVKVTKKSNSKPKPVI